MKLPHKIDIAASFTHRSTVIQSKRGQGWGVKEINPTVLIRCIKDSNNRSVKEKISRHLILKI